MENSWVFLYFPKCPWDFVISPDAFGTTPEKAFMIFEQLNGQYMAFHVIWEIIWSIHLFILFYSPEFPWSFFCPWAYLRNYMLNAYPSIQLEQLYGWFMPLFIHHYMCHLKNYMQFILFSLQYSVQFEQSPFLCCLCKFSKYVINSSRFSIFGGNKKTSKAVGNQTQIRVVVVFSIHSMNERKTFKKLSLAQPVSFWYFRI